MNPSYTINDPGHPLHGKTIYLRCFACCTAVVVRFCRDGRVYMPVNKRGPGCSTFPGKYNVPCGFLEDDETGPECCARELYEENGIKIPPERFKFYGNNLEQDPSTRFEGHAVNRYIAILTDEDFENGVVDQTHAAELGTTGGEKDEVSERRWMKLGYYSMYEWAFDQKELLAQVCEDIRNGVIANPYATKLCL